jgi:hypothetical protein
MSEDLCTCNTGQDTLSKMTSVMWTSVPAEEAIIFAFASYEDNVVVAIVISVIVVMMSAIIIVIVVPLVSTRTVNRASSAFVVIVLILTLPSHLTIFDSITTFNYFVRRLFSSEDDLLLRCRFANDDGGRWFLAEDDGLRLGP